MINAVSQFLQMCRNIRIKFLSWAYMYTTLRERERQRQRQRFGSDIPELRSCVKVEMTVLGSPSLM